MDSVKFKDDNGLIWTAAIKLGIGKADYGVDNYDPAKPHLLVFTSVRGHTYKKSVGSEKSSIDSFTVEDLKAILKELQSSEP